MDDVIRFVSDRPKEKLKSSSSRIAIPMKMIRNHMNLTTMRMKSSQRKRKLQN